MTDLGVIGIGFCVRGRGLFLCLSDKRIPTALQAFVIDIAGLALQLSPAPDRLARELFDIFLGVEVKSTLRLSQAPAQSRDELIAKRNIFLRRRRSETQQHVTP